MVKTKKHIPHIPLVVTGYILFSLLVLTTLLSTTIPFGRMLFDPRVLHGNVVVITVSLTIGAILPALIGYIIGNYSVKSKSKLSHHFNGVLLGILGFWLMVYWAVFMPIPDAFFTDQNMRISVLNVLPAISVAIITTILAIMHIRSRNAKQDILEYWPFSVLLIASILVLPLWSLLNSIVTNSVSFYSLVTLAIVIVLGFISYVTLRKTRISRYYKLLWSIVSISVVFVSMYLSNQLANAAAVYLQPYPTMETQLIVSCVGYVIALTGWIIYWSKQAKALR
ncbi:MAG: hypothetical protein WAO28_01810 [Candidatus Microsaccharimonas sp.]